MEVSYKDAVCTSAALAQHCESPIVCASREVLQCLYDRYRGARRSCPENTLCIYNYIACSVPNRTAPDTTAPPRWLPRDASRVLLQSNSTRLAR